MRKILEQNFPTKQDALTFLETAGWTFAGRKGLFRRYDSYTGITVSHYGLFDTVRVEEYEVRLSSDGYAALFVGRQSGLLMTTHIPDEVWNSYEAWGDRRRSRQAEAEEMEVVES